MLHGFSCVQLFATLRTVDHQAPLSMGFSRHKPCPPPGDLLDPGIEPMSLIYPELTDGFFPVPPVKPKFLLNYVLMILR